MSIINRLLSKGYFPKEIPPAFTTKKLADFVKKTKVFNASNCMLAPNNKGVLAHPQKGYSHLCKHNLARLDGTNRSLHIPHPAHFYYLCEAIGSKLKEIKTHYKKSSLSISTPKQDSKSIRAFIPSESGAARSKRRLIDRSQGDFLIITDVANFYGSVYSHSIPWALHTKAVAKTNRNDFNLLGNAIDTYVRNGQDGQTLGLPIGTDTSFMIAELILSSIDRELKSRQPKIKGFRFYDDYEIVCQDESTAQKILADLDDCVTEYELSLNRRKTRIVKLPELIEQPWVTELRLFELPMFSSKADEKIIDFANIIFPLSKKYPHDPVLRYSLVKLASTEEDDVTPFGVNFSRRNFLYSYSKSEVYQQFLIQIYRAEPHLSHIIAGELLRYEQATGDLNLDLVKDAISSHILQYASSKAYNEVAWALWLAIQFKLKLKSEIVNKISNIDDNFVAILALDAQDKGLFRKKLNTSLWQSSISVNEIYSNNWLLCYEAAAKGWLPIKDGSNYINSHPCFGDLNKNGVSFYDPNSYNNITETLEHLEIDTELYST